MSSERKALSNQSPPINPDLIERLRERAAREGRDLNELLAKWLEQASLVASSTSTGPAQITTTRALELSEARLRSLIESQTAYVIRTDMNGDLTYVNDQFITSNGWLYGGPDQVLGRSSMDSIYADDHVLTEQTVMACMEHPHEPQQVTLRKFKEEGGLRWTLWEFVCLTNPDNTPREIQCVGFDVTQQKQAEEALRRSERRYQSVVNSQQELIYRCDVDFQLTFVNEAFARAFNAHADELIGNNLLDYLVADERAFMREHLKALRASKTPQKLEFRMTLPDGSQRWQLWSSNVILDDGGEIAEIQSVGRDTNEQKANEMLAIENARLKARFQREQDANDRVQQTVTGLLQDLRTPLSIIGTSKEILQRYGERLSPEKQLEKYQAIDRQLHFILNELDHTMMLVQGDYTDRPFHPTPTNLAALCQISLEAISEFKRDDHTLWFVDHSDLGYVEADEILISRILLNLLTNAVKFSPDGGEIRLELHANDESIRLHVVDEGLGITAGDLPHIFAPFYRSERSQGGIGTGLGLSIVRDCVQLHGGTIRVESEPNEGTRFVVEIPRIDANRDV